MIVKFDELNRFKIPNITLCYPDSKYNNKTGRISRAIGQITNAKNLTIDYNFNAVSTGSFTYQKPNNRIEYIYFQICQNKYIFIEDLGFCVITSVQESKENGLWVKTISFSTCEKELENFEVPYFVKDDESVVIPIYSADTTNKNGAFNYVLENCLSWKLSEANIDTDLLKDENGNLIKKMFADISATNLYEFIFNDIQEVFDCIVECDYKTRNFYIYSKDNYVEKHKTSIVINKNLYDSISNSGDLEDAYTALSVVGDGDIDIHRVNPIGNNLIYNFNNYQDWLDQDTQTALLKWQSNINNYQNLYRVLNNAFFKADQEYNTLLQERDVIDTQYNKQLEVWNNAWDSIKNKSSTITDISDFAESQLKILSNYAYGYIEDGYEIPKIIVSNPNEADWENDIHYVLVDISENSKSFKYVDKNTYEGSYSTKDLYKLTDIDWSDLYFCSSTHGSITGTSPNMYWKATKEDYHNLLQGEIDSKYGLTKTIQNTTYVFFTPADERNVQDMPDKTYVASLSKLHYGWKQYYSDNSSTKDYMNDLKFSKYIDNMKVGVLYKYTYDIEKNELSYNQESRNIYWGLYYKDSWTGSSSATKLISTEIRDVSVSHFMKKNFSLSYQGTNYSYNYEKLKSSVNTIQNNCALDCNSREILSITLGDGDSGISFSLGDNCIFNSDTLRALNCYIRTGEYTYNKITKTDNMTEDETFERANELYQRGIDKLNTIVNNLKKFSIDVKSFIFDLAFVNFTAQLCSGCTITVETSENQFEEIYLTNFSINYDDKTLSFTLGNRYNKFDIKSLFDEVLGDISKSTSQIERLKQRVYKLEQANKNK